MCVRAYKFVHTCTQVRSQVRACAWHACATLSSFVRRQQLNPSFISAFIIVVIIVLTYNSSRSCYDESHNSRYDSYGDRRPGSCASTSVRMHVCMLAARAKMDVRTCLGGGWFEAGPFEKAVTGRGHVGHYSIIRYHNIEVVIIIYQ